MSKKDPHIDYLSQLVGKTIESLCIDDSKETIEGTGCPLYGLQLSGGTIVWILADPEGNGPGFLEIRDRIQI